MLDDLTPRLRYLLSGILGALAAFACVGMAAFVGLLCTSAPPGIDARVTEAHATMQALQTRVAELEPRAQALGMPPSVPSPTATHVAQPAPTPGPTAVAPTPRPQPTPAPTPTPKPRAVITKESKLGLGVYAHGGGHFLDMLIAAEPGVILLMEPDIEFAREVRRYFPRAFIVGRRDFGDVPPLDPPEERGRAAADHVARLAVPLRGVVDAWMGYNEVTTSGDYEGYRKYNRFQVAFARRLQNDYGIPAVAANDAAGVIDIEDYGRYFAEALRESRYFGIHAYPPEGSRNLRDDATWFMLRYRRYVEALRRQGVQHGPIIITESGANLGWRGKISAEEMVEQFFWYTRELEKDPYVIGHAIFGVFGNGDFPTWELASSGILERLGTYRPG